jgi:hypothetical protein
MPGRTHTLQPQEQQSTSPLTLRTRYTKEQVTLYFKPAPDRDPTIGKLQSQRQQLIQQLAIQIAACVGLFLLLIMTATNTIWLALCALGGIILLLYFVRQILSIKLPPVNTSLMQERAMQRKETAYHKRVRPPNEIEFEAWIDEIAQEIFDSAPDKLHLRARPEYLKWKLDREKGITTVYDEEPEQYGTAFYMEGNASSTEDSPQLYRKTKDPAVRRVAHYATYEFTSLFITEDYIAIYANKIDLFSPELDDESFEYGYHQHLSHLLLKAHTITVPLQPGQAASQQTESIVLKANTLSLMFDSGREMMYNISTLRLGSQTKGVTNIDDIHKTLTRELIDHGRSMPKAFKEGNGP